MYKVLCLHGSEQSAKIFKAKIGRFPHKCRSSFELKFLDAPNLLNKLEGETELKSWYTRDPLNGMINIESLQNSLQFIENEFKMNGNYDGILGFSMGGSIASILAMLPDRYPEIKFIISIGARDISELLNDLNMTDELVYKHIKSLHVMGKTDQSVPIESSIELMKRFYNPIILEHEKGHYVPTQAQVLDFYIEFMKSCFQNEDISIEPNLLDAEYKVFKYNSDSHLSSNVFESTDSLDSNIPILSDVMN